MYLKRLMILVSLIITINSLQAQRLEYMQPVGYQSPFLKSGHFITSLYYYQRQIESDYSDYNSYNGSKYFNFIGYLGLTDFLTLSTRVVVYPDQKIIWETGESTMKRENDFHLNPELTLSYRPIKYLEIFGSYNYRIYTTRQGPYTFLQSVPVEFDPETGQFIYEEKMFYSSGMNPYDTSTYFFRFGLTYSGKLW